MKLKKIPANIAYYSEGLGIPQQTLANALGISRQTFHRKKENGGFTVAELGIMARIMHCKVEDLVRGI